MKQKKKYVFHVIGNPIYPTHEMYFIDAFTQLAIRFCKLMTRDGHTVYFYGVEEYKDQIECTEFIPILKLAFYDQFREQTQNFYHPAYFMAHDKRFAVIRNTIHVEFMTKYFEALAKHVKRWDDIFIRIADQYEYINCIVVTLCNMGGYYPGIHSGFVTRDYLESQSKEYLETLKTKKVIYPWFDIDDFEYQKPIPKTVLYLGRCIYSKGITGVFNVAKLLPDYHFVVAGAYHAYDPITRIMDTGELCTNGETFKIDFSQTPNVRIEGVVQKERRKQLLNECECLYQPTVYREPCGFNVIEAMLSGKPCITSAHGGFLNTMVQGKTGYLCTTTQEYLHAFQNVASLDHEWIQNYARERFCEERALKTLKNFFHKVVSYEYWKDEEEICAITLKPLSQLKKVTKLKCGHQFCSESIYLWFQTSDLCPLCRSKICELKNE